MMFNHNKRLLTIIAVSVTNLSLLIAFANPVGPQSPQVSGSRNLNQGDLIYKAEKLLAEKGYWIKKVDRIKDSSTFHAVVAFQKVEGRKKTGRLTLSEVEAMQKAKRPYPAFVGIPHIEIDLRRQVLFLVGERDVVTHILPVSTGSGKAYYEGGKRQIAYTPRGIFTIERQIKGVRRAPLGVLYHPNYFYQGVAIHGSNSIPFYPASHGCIRIPRFAAKEFSDLVSVGLTVIVHELEGQAERLIAKTTARKPKPGTDEILPCGRYNSGNRDANAD